MQAPSCAWEGDAHTALGEARRVVLVRVLPSTHRDTPLQANPYQRRHDRPTPGTAIQCSNRSVGPQPRYLSSMPRPSLVHCSPPVHPVHRSLPWIAWSRWKAMLAVPLGGPRALHALHTSSSIIPCGASAPRWPMSHLALSVPVCVTALRQRPSSTSLQTSGRRRNSNPPGEHIRTS